MALPNPSAVNTQYNSSIGESISTGLKDAFVSMQTNFLSKSPILKMLGKGVLDERARVKQQERYEKTGRDSSGRKLTKDQLEDRASKRAERGALGEIRDTLQFWKDTGFGGILSNDSKNMFMFEAMSANILLIKQHLTEGITRVETLSRDEATNARLQAARDAEDAQSQFTGEGAEFADEKEKEDDKDQAEAEKKSQGFFSKLFGKRKDGSDEGSGLLGLLSPLLGLFSAGGILGFIGTILAPIGAAIMAILPVLAGAIGILLPIILAGVAGVMLANWIDDQSDELQKSRDKLNAQGEAFVQNTDESGKKLYKVVGEDGKVSYATAEALGKTDEQLASQIENDPTSNVSKMQYAVKTQDGIATGEVASGQGADAMLAARFGRGEITLDQANMQANMEGYNKYLSIVGRMTEYQNTFRKKMNAAVQGNGAARGLVNDYNSIISDAAKAQKDYPEQFDAGRMINLVDRVPIFKGSMPNNKFDPNRKAEFDEGGQGILSQFIDDEEVILPVWGGIDVGDSGELENAKFNPTQNAPQISTLTAENLGLSQAKTPPATVVNTTNNVVDQSSKTTVLGSPSAQQPNQQSTGFNRTKQ
jgi:hypothetical protein